jgi:nucleoside-diphosphate-sugar epimerase
VERVVITSSLAAMIHPWAGDWPGNWPGHTYSEDDWNPITPEQAYQDPLCGYRASKKQAEQAAWRFMREEQPTFTLATICPPLMLGPTASGDLWDGDLGHVNESLKRVRDMVFGQARADHAIPPNGASFIFTDVRDAARYHVLAMEKPAAAGQRCFIPTGWFCNREIVDIARKHFPELEHSLPPIDTPGGGYPADGLYKVDNSRTQAIFDGDFERFRSLEECIVDTVKSLQAVLEGGPAREGS